MKDKKVPEDGDGIPVRVRAELDELFKDLQRTNAAFKACRGSFGEFPFERLLGCEEDKDAPAPDRTAVLNRYNSWVGETRIILGHLARLRRDGKMIAYRELERALCDPDYVMLGETVPAEKTESGVLLMFGLQRTLILARWLYTSTFKDGQDWVLKRKIPEDRGDCGALTPSLLEVFPQLEESFRNPRRPPEEFPPTDVFFHSVGDAYDRLRRKYGENHLHPIWIDRSRTCYWSGWNPVAYFVSDATEDQVLSLYSRTEQKNLSVFQFRYPQVLNRDMYNDGACRVWIGFHPETETKWQQLWEPYMSFGCQDGYRAVLLDEKRMKEPFAGTQEVYQAPCGPYPGIVERLLESGRVALTFSRRR